MTPADLDRVAALLYGPRWQTALAAALGTNERVVRYWIAGERPIPERVRGEVVALLLKRRDALDRKIAALKASPAG
ncbi:MAG: hypothetical protein U1E23_09640 [Reyranellaceae bacterium]